MIRLPCLLKGILFFCFILLVSTSGRAHEANPADGDSIRVHGKSPVGAMLRSSILPGWGQWYNHQKIKSILVLGGELGLIWNASYQNRIALRSKTVEEREFYRNNRNLSIWWFVGVYFLNIMDAYVDAQLWHFDIGPDLSGRMSPKYYKARFVLNFAL
jgi:hypothetical protein